MRILLVDDDENLMDLLAERLIQQRYAVDIAVDGSSAQTYLDLFDYDLVVLDLMLPDGDGIEFAKHFRRDGYANPLMILTAKESTAEKVKALDAGADDYVVKPFDFDELCARIRALLRREHNGLPTVLSWGALQLDPSACKTTYNDNPVRLTPKEFSMMELFLRHPYRVYSLGAIIDDLWSFEDPPGEDAVRTHIKGLRRKLKAAGAPKDLIKTVYGLGYQLNESAVVSESAVEDAVENVAAAESSSRLKQNGAQQNTAAQNRTQQNRTQQQIDENHLEASQLPTQLGVMPEAVLSATSAVTTTSARSGKTTSDQRISSSNKTPLNTQQANTQQAMQAQGKNDNIQLLSENTAAQNTAAQNAAAQNAVTENTSELTQLNHPSRLASNRRSPVAEPDAVNALSSSQLKQRITEACDRYLVSVSKQLETLDRLLSAIADGKLSSELYQRSLAIAHNLSGSLGSFGFAEGSQIARALETQLRRLAIAPADAQISDEVLTQLLLPQLPQLSQLVQQLHQLTKQAELSVSADMLSNTVEGGFPVLLVVSEDDVFIEQLAAIAAQVQLQSQHVKTLSQAQQRLRAARCDLLLIDVDTSGAHLFDSDSTDSDSQPYGLSHKTLQRLEQFKRDYRLPVMMTAHHLTLKHRLSLIQQGIDVVSDRTSDPLQIALAAASMIRSEGKQGRVAIVDDDPDMLALFKTSLEPWGFQITPFESAIALWQWLDSGLTFYTQHPPIDILVLDIEMPTFSGLELCRVIRADARFQSIPILFLTKHQESALRTQAYQMGGDDFMHKAVAPAELAIRLRNQLKRACRIDAS